MKNENNPNVKAVEDDALNSIRNENLLRLPPAPKPTDDDLAIMRWEDEGGSVGE